MYSPPHPHLLTQMLALNSAHHPHTPLAFSLSLSLSHPQIREQFDSGEDVELADDMNPHDVACLLKEFFRSLPEPLMTIELFGPFISTRSNYPRNYLRACVYKLVDFMYQRGH